jgi:hypothetical protein
VPEARICIVLNVVTISGSAQGSVNTALMRRSPGLCQRRLTHSSRYQAISNSDSLIGDLANCMS